MKGDRIKGIEYSNKFLKSLKKLPERIIVKAEEKEIIFRKNPLDSRLNTHKLSGKDKGCWAFWITDYYRIKFIFGIYALPCRNQGSAEGRFLFSSQRRKFCF